MPTCTFCHVGYPAGAYRAHAAEPSHRALLGRGLAKQRRAPRHTDPEVLTAIGSSASMAEAAERLGYTRERVRQIAKRNGITGADLQIVPRRGPRPGQSPCPNCGRNTIGGPSHDRHCPGRHRVTAMERADRDYAAFRERNRALAAEAEANGGLDTRLRREMADRLGLTEVAIQRAVWDGGYRPRYKPVGTRIRDTRIVALSAAGRNRHQIAVEVGCSDSTVYRVLRQARTEASQ